MYYNSHVIVIRGTHSLKDVIGYIVYIEEKQVMMRYED